MNLHFSVLLNYINTRWKVIHWHASRPNQLQNEEDAYGINSWKQKAVELEKVVNEKTADLVLKNRELEIEGTLERVRARTMEMRKQNDLPGVLDLLVEQLVKLGVRLEVANFSNNTTGGDWDLWIEVIAIDGSVYNNYIHFPRINHPYFNHVDKNIETYKADGTDLFKDVFSKAEKDSWQDYIYSQTIYKDIVPQEHKQILYDRPGYAWSMVLLKDTWVSICRFDATPFSDEEDKLLKRFANAFGQAYTRFLDLQKAEAQAREAQIEVALERVRSHAMAMQSPEELSTIIGTVFTELTKLDLALTRCVIWVFEPATNAARWWMANSEDPSQPMNFFIKYHEHPAYLTFVKEWKNQNAKFVYDLKGKDKIKWDEILFNETELIHLPDVVKNGMREPERVLLSASFNNFGGLNVASLEPLSEEHFNLLLRFAKVFDLTYTRFLDLQKAEAQAKEAKIEAALEKVRGKAMAMHTSNDLSITSSMVIGELRKLGINPIRCGVGILNKETHKALLYTATSLAGGDNLSVVGWVLLEGDPVLENIYQKWLNDEDYFPELKGDSMKAYYQQLLTGLSVLLPDFESGQKHYGHFFSVSVGCLYAWADVKYNAEEIKVLKRFAAIMDLTFRRYFELQKSEVSAKEAVKQAALDRIRADIASMRTVTDLDRITPLIWNELTIIGIPFIRCGVFIMDEQQELIHTFLSTPDGKAIAAIHIPYNTPGKIKIIPENWRKKITYTDHWNDPDFIDFANALLHQHAIESADQYLSGVPHGGFYLHFVPFLQGMMYVGNPTELSAAQVKLIQSMAEAFSTAYSRYEDFNKLESAKKQVDSALNDLQSTQKQLIQSEKMASLGELTAGIAHEIQNPLNFVNNFSELSNELIEELRIKNEKLKIEDEEVNDLLNDLTQNLEKINLHGKRADGIVKNMLQHSRTSTGKKELTDINALADEYLRLGFHGMRAKDKSFNAKFETEFDNSLEKINTVPQDIGRVFLNLLNNAFYAVNEKQKSEGDGYVPTVTVATRKENNHVTITVKDNGGGIPEKIKDKIFQPFFTTKPTGQGTGLGLSLSYDIIKAHGGNLTIESKENEGTEFTVQLPVG